MKLVIIAIIAVLISKSIWDRLLSSWVTKMKGHSKEEAPASTEAGKFLETLDWSVTTPGKALSDLVGPQWVNWIMWVIIVILALLLIQWLVQWLVGLVRGTPTNTTSLKNILPYLGKMILWGAFISALIYYAAQVWGPKETGASLEVDQVVLQNTGNPEGRQAVRMMPRKGIVTVHLPAQVRQGIISHACLEAKDANKVLKNGVMFMVVSGDNTDTNKFEITKESQDELDAANIQNVRVTFELKLVPMGISPCSYVR